MLRLGSIGMDCVGKESCSSYRNNFTKDVKENDHFKVIFL